MILLIENHRIEALLRPCPYFLQQEIIWHGKRAFITDIQLSVFSSKHRLMIIRRKKEQFCLKEKQLLATLGKTFGLAVIHYSLSFSLLCNTHKQVRGRRNMKK